MADLETRVDKLETRVSSIEVTVEKLSQKVDDYIAESRAARAKTDEELKEMRSDMKALNQRMDDTIGQIRNLTIAAMVGIGAGVLGVGAIAAAVISFVLSK